MAKEKKEKKARKKRSGWEIAWQIIDTLLVFSIAAIYIYRLFSYKKYFDDLYYNASEQESAFLYEVLTKKAEILDSSNGLIKNDNGTYTYKGKVDDNFVFFNNRLYRVLGVDENSAIKIVTEDVETNFVIYENDVFENTSLFRWLNECDDIVTTDKKGNEVRSNYSGIYARSLYTPYRNFIKITNNTAVVDDLSNIPDQESLKDYYFSLLTLEEYSKTSGANGFLNNGTVFWLANSNSEGRFWLVDENGNITLSDGAGEMHGVRVTGTLSYEAIVVAGDGTRDNPFVIENDYFDSDAKTFRNIETLGKAITRQYVSYGGLLWKINSFTEEGNVIAMLDGVLKDEEGEKLKMGFGSLQYTLKTRNSVGYYLNNTFLKSLSGYESYLVEFNGYSGQFRAEDQYDYASAYDRSYTAYVGIPQLGMLFMNEENDIFISNAVYDSDTFINTVSDFNWIFADLPDNGHCVRPVVCFRGNLAIVSGTGTAEDPFIVEVSENGEAQ